MNILSLIIFLFILISVLLGGHWFIYFSVIKFLAITSFSVKMWLGGALFFLSVSFILASILAHYSEGLLARTIYSIFSFWLGMGWNLIMGFIISWLAIGVAKILGQSLDYKYLMFFSIIFMFIFSVWGVWNAYNPKIRNISVKIKNLPQEWKNKKIIQLSDVHLGHIYGKKFLTKIVKKINLENPDIVFITGDLFDGMDGSLSHLVSPLNDIKAPNGIYFITGNHETYLGVNNSITALKNTTVQSLDDKMINIDGVQILGISYPERGMQSDFSKKLKNLKEFDAKKPNILLYHNPNSAKEAKKMGINLQLAGHTHRGQIFPFGIITYLIYGRYHNGLTQEDDFSIYTSAGTGTWGPMMRTSGRSEIVVFSFE